MASDNVTFQYCSDQNKLKINKIFCLNEFLTET